MDDFLLFENALNVYNKISSQEVSSSFDQNDYFLNKDDILENEEYDESEFKDDYQVYKEDEYDVTNDDSIVAKSRKQSIDEDIKKVENKESDNENNITCQHKNVTTESGTVLCFDCGKELEKTIFQDKEWRYYGVADSRRSSDPNRVHIRKVDDRSIYKDVENMGFSDKIIHLANQIYLQVTKGQILRGNSRKSVVFACIFHSFKIKENAQTHDKLIKIFNLNKKTALKGLKYVSLNAPKDSLIHTTYITPENIIEDIMDKFNAKDDQKKEVIDIYNKIQNKSSKINRSRPQSIAAGIVYFWISYKNIDIPIKNFAKKVELSELTIIKISKIISEVLGIIPESWL